MKLKLNLSHTQQKSIYGDHLRKKSSFPLIEITIDAAKTCLKVFLITRNDPQAVTLIRCFRLPQKCTLKTPPHHRGHYNIIYKKEKKKQTQILPGFC